MQTTINKKPKPIFKQLLLGVAFLLFLILSGQFSISAGLEVPFTLQTLVIGLLVFYLNRNTAIAVIAVYLLLAYLEFPVLSGGDGGWEKMSDASLGFLIGFLVAAFLSDKVLNFHDNPFYKGLNSFFMIHLIILLCGFIVMSIQTGYQGALATSWALLPGAVIKSILGAVIIWLFDRMKWNQFLS